MPLLNFFGTGTPPGTWAVYTDGTPRIVVGHGFYFTAGSPARGSNIVGARAYVPAGHIGEDVELTLWRGVNALVGVGSGIDLAGTALASVTVTIPSNDAGWVEGTFGSPVTIDSTTLYLYGAAVEFLDSPGLYHIATGARVAGLGVQHPTIPTWYWSETDTTYAGIYYRIGTGATAPATMTTNYGGADLIIDIPESNVSPTANAGTDQTVTVNNLVTLNGSGSSDSDGTISTYTWTQVSGTTVTLSGTGSNRTFTPTVTGVYTFGLTVTDDDGATSTQDQVTITATSGGGGNVAPSANAGADQSVNTNQQVTLNGSGSSDSDGSIVGYNWTQVSGTSVTLTGSGASRTFTPTSVGIYVFGLTVTDNGGAMSTQDNVTVTVTAPPSTPTTVAEENALTGIASSQWFQGLSGINVPSFARSTYYTPGQTAQFSVDCNEPFTIQIFRLGHYAGLGAREVQTPVAATPAAQPAPVAISGGNGAVTCAAWSNNASWAIPSSAVPGWYMAMFRRNSDSVSGYSLFCVSDANSKRSIVIVSSDSTWHVAYNGFGGNNVYGTELGIGSTADRAFCSTYDKPVYTKDYVPQTHFFNNTYPYLKWSERMGINAAHTTIEQIKNDPTILDGRQLIIWTGHNEYVPQNVVDKTKALLSGGQKMMNLSGNDFFWRVKFTNGAFSSSTNGRVMWCKKDTMDGPSTGPDAIPSHVGGVPFTTDAEWTGTWQDTRWSLREPSEDMFGDQFVGNGIRFDNVMVPAAMKDLPPWRNCPGVQALASGQTYQFTPGTLGMEWDRPMVDNPNVDQILFSTTIVNLTNNAADADGQNYNTTVPDARHAFSMVKNGSGYVANFNSDQWPWALDALHLRGSEPADANAMQMMLNVIYDFGGTANASSVANAGLITPTPVSNIDTAYGFTPTPGGGTGGPTWHTAYYSDGITWKPVGQEAVE